MVAVSLVISVVALALGSASLGWQVLSWTRSGRVAKVVIEGLARYPHHPIGIDWDASNAKHFEGATGEEGWCSVVVRNTGRLDFDVKEVHLRFGAASYNVWPRDDEMEGPETPVRVLAGSSASWHVRGSYLKESANRPSDSTAPYTVGATVWLGDGAEFRSSQAIDGDRFLHDITVPLTFDRSSHK